MQIYSSSKSIAYPRNQATSKLGLLIPSRKLSNVTNNENPKNHFALKIPLKIFTPINIRVVIFTNAIRKIIRFPPSNLALEFF